MNITDIKIRKTFPEGNVKAVVSVILDDFIAIHEIKVIQGNGRIFAAMPNRLDSKMKEFVDMCFDPKSPISGRLKQTLLKMLEEREDDPK